MINTYSVFRLVSVPLALVFISGCVTYQKPTGYKHFPEYGYLPVIDNKIVISYVANDFVVDNKSLDSNRIGNILLKRRESLPQSLESAKELVGRNMFVLFKHQHSEVAKEIVMIPIELPAAILYFAPGIAILTASLTESTEHHKNNKAGNDTSIHDAAHDAKNENGQEGLDKRVVIHVVDKINGRPVPGASVLPILSPISFDAYGNDAGFRTYPNSVKYNFHITNDLAILLAGHMLDTPIIDHKKGTSIRIGTSDEEGVWSHVNDADNLKPQLGVSEEPVTFYLIAKKGYKATIAKIIVRKDDVKPLELRVELARITEVVVPEENFKANPWAVIDRLQKQVDYFIETKYDTVFANYKRDAPPPSLEMGELGELVKLAEEVAPDYPLVSMARFFYDMEMGRTEEAKKHAVFIKDDVYLRAVYQMSWETGLPLNIGLPWN
jgi:hypothetical protein